MFYNLLIHHANGNYRFANKYYFLSKLLQLIEIIHIAINSAEN